jgi:hypothetical protein
MSYSGYLEDVWNENNNNYYSLYVKHLKENLEWFQKENPSHEKTRTTNSGEDIDSFPR